MSLKLSLRANEKIMVEGILLQNGAKNAKISVETPHAHVFRMRDAIPERVQGTELGDAAFFAQEILSGLIPDDLDNRTALHRDIEAMPHSDGRDTALLELSSGNVYKAFKALRTQLEL